MTPSFMGLIATMLPGVRPSISLASRPTASTRPLILLIATIDGSLTTMPLPRANTQVLAVPRSIARSLENRESIERRLNGAPWSVVSQQSAVNSQQSAVNSRQSTVGGRRSNGASRGNSVKDDGVMLRIDGHSL